MRPAVRAVLLLAVGALPGCGAERASDLAGAGASDLGAPMCTEAGVSPWRVAGSGMVGGEKGFSVRAAYLVPRPDGTVRLRLFSAEVPCVGAIEEQPGVRSLEVTLRDETADVSALARTAPGTYAQLPGADPVLRTARFVLTGDDGSTVSAQTGTLELLAQGTCSATGTFDIQFQGFRSAGTFSAARCTP